MTKTSTSIAYDGNNLILTMPSGHEVTLSPTARGMDTLVRILNNQRTQITPPTLGTAASPTQAMIDAMVRAAPVTKISANHKPLDPEIEALDLNLEGLL